MVVCLLWNAGRFGEVVGVFSNRRKEDCAIQ